MGIPRPYDPHGLTEPEAWVEADETVLGAHAEAFAVLTTTVSAQLEEAQSVRLEMFEGVGLWSGGAAGAAHGALSGRISDLQSRKTGLESCVTLFASAYAAVVAERANY